MLVNAFAAPSAGAELIPYDYDAGELGPLEVDVEVTHCGICHTDLMVIDGAERRWESSSPPLDLDSRPLNWGIGHLAGQSGHSYVGASISEPTGRGSFEFEMQHRQRQLSGYPGAHCSRA